MSRTGAGFFIEKKSWSEIKHDILRKYLDIYVKKRGSAQPLMYFVDGFAGEGWYGEGGCRRPGSPILAAEHAQAAVNEDKRYRLKCIFVEANGEHAGALRSALAEYDQRIVTVHEGTFDKCIPTVLEEIGGAPTLFFLDPFGVKGVELSDIQALLNRDDTELLLRFDVGSLRRLAGHVDGAAAERVGKMRLVSLVLGEDPELALYGRGWVRELHARGFEEWVDWTVEVYGQRLIARSPHLKRAVAYPIRESYDAAPKYYLVFATRYEPAIPLMNDVVCQADEDLFENTVVVQGAQHSFFGEIRDDERGQQLRALMEQIHAYGLVHQGFTRPQIIQHFANEHFGVFSSKHYRKAIDSLVKERRASFGSGRTIDQKPIQFA